LNLTISPGNIIHVRRRTPEGAPIFTPRTTRANEFDELKTKDGATVIWKKLPGSFAQTELQKELDDKQEVGLDWVHGTPRYYFPHRTSFASFLQIRMERRFGSG
jgi:hypothetical protein